MSYDAVHNIVSKVQTHVLERNGSPHVQRGTDYTFAYDDAGQRLVKRGAMGETDYVNQFYMVRNGAIVTKNIFAGITRIASKLQPGTVDLTVPRAGAIIGKGRPTLRPLALGRARRWNPGHCS